MHSNTKSRSVKNVRTVVVGGVSEVTGTKRRGGSGVGRRVCMFVWKCLGSVAAC